MKIINYSALILGAFFAYTSYGKASQQFEYQLFIKNAPESLKKSQVYFSFIGPNNSTPISPILHTLKLIHTKTGPKTKNSEPPAAYQWKNFTIPSASSLDLSKINVAFSVNDKSCGTTSLNLFEKSTRPVINVDYKTGACDLRWG